VYAAGLLLSAGARSRIDRQLPAVRDLLHAPALRLRAASCREPRCEAVSGVMLMQSTCDDKLPVGRLAHQGAIFLKLSQEGIEMERELFMGSSFRSRF